MGSQVFVWGGLDASGTALDTGAIYDVDNDTWREIARDANTPSPRHSASAVWTGSVVVVWGGIGAQALSSGALYDPDTDRWSPMHRAPVARGAAPAAYLDDYELMAVWGGQNETGNLLEGIDLYDPNQDVWTAGDTSGNPGKRQGAAWCGGLRSFWVFGGLRDGSQMADDGTYYSLIDDRWTDVGSWSGSARSGAFSAFLNIEFHVWGGRNESGALSNGASYTLGTFSGSWRSLDTTDAPSARSASYLETGWSFAIDGDQMLILGGLDDQNAYLRDGGIYDTTRRSWKAIPTWPSTSSHAFGTAAYASGAVVLWGGRDGGALTLEGLRYRP